MNTTHFPQETDTQHVESHVTRANPNRPLYALTLGVNEDIVTADAHVARDYYTAIAKAAQELVDAADQAVLAEALGDEEACSWCSEVFPRPVGSYHAEDACAAARTDKVGGPA